MRVSIYLNVLRNAFTRSNCCIRHTYAVFAVSRPIRGPRFSRGGKRGTYCHTREGCQWENDVCYEIRTVQ